MRKAMNFMTEKLYFLSYPLCFLSFFILDLSFRYFYRFEGSTRVLGWQPLCFTIGWSLLLTALLALLPRLARRIVMLTLAVFYSVLLLVHAGLYSLTGSFFSFSSLGFAEEGVAFFSWTYISIRPLLILCVIGSLLFMGLAAFLTPKYPKGRKNWRIFRIASGAVACVCVVLIGVVHTTFDTGSDTIWWGAVYEDSEKEIYADFTNANESLMLTGLFHYTFRDFCVTNGIGVVSIERWELDRYYDAIAADISGDNEMTGAFAGKNLMMIMMESIDTWMVTEDFMPNLWNLQQESMNFENFYTPLYLSASTFNTEVITLTGQAPPTNDFNNRGYLTNSFSLALPNLFLEAGYRTDTFHGANASIYNRGHIHTNWGIEHYYNWSDMGMENYMLDSQMINGYDMMVSDAPFFDFIITYSGHGPYTDELGVIAEQHYEAAEEAVARSGVTSDNEETMEEYIRAVAHVMETDAFIGELLEKLEEDGHLEDTVLVLYGDHYSKYLSDKEFINELKGIGADNQEDLYKTPCMIYAYGYEGQSITKYTSSHDVVPTLINLFDLDVDRRYYVGDDIFGDKGGIVVLDDYSWFNEDYTMAEAAARTDEEAQEISAYWRERIKMSMRLMATDYFSQL